jgi:vanillate O-demethylase ferredoxin subunit
MDAVRATAEHYLPAQHVHFELFSVAHLCAKPEGEEASFIIELARSGRELTVPGTSSVLDVLEQAGVMVPFSCREGLCRTCECSVLDGEVDHRDYVLGDAERDANNVMLVCVSRAKSKKLTLDL